MPQGSASGTDPIDSRLGQLGAAPDAGRPRWPSRRLALGLAATPMPVFLLLLTGAAIGPAGLGLLTTRLLTALEPATTAALTALGVLVGLDVDLLRRSGAPRLLRGAALESLVVCAGLTAAFVAAAPVAGWPWPGLTLLPLLAGVCGASSASLATTRAVPSLATRLGDLDDLLPIGAGAIILAYAAGDTAGERVALLATAAGLAAVGAAAGALLVSGSEAEGEQRVYTTGILLLLTGVAAYLSASALFVGAIAGAAWNTFHPVARERLARDVRHLQHPVVVLLMVVAGALAPATLETVAAGGIFALARVVLKMLAGAGAAAIVPGVGRWVGLTLLAPGVSGVAFALHVQLAAGVGGAAVPLLGIVVWGAVASDLLALLVAEPEPAS